MSVGLDRQVLMWRPGGGLRWKLCVKDLLHGGGTSPLLSSVSAKVALLQREEASSCFLPLRLESQAPLADTDESDRRACPLLQHDQFMTLDVYFL